MPKLGEYTGNTLVLHFQRHFRDEIVKEEVRIRKIEKQASKFRSRAWKSPEDLKRHDQVQQDERKVMWNAQTELGWGFRKIGSVFGRDWRTVKKAVETYEPGKRQMPDSAEKARAVIGKCRLEVASYSPVNLLQEWLDKAREDAITRYYTDEDVEMIYSKARERHGEPLQLKPFLRVENDPAFGLLRQRFPTSDIWTALHAWHKRVAPYIQAFYRMLRKTEYIVAYAVDTLVAEADKRGVKGIDWIDSVSFQGFAKRCKTERLLTVFMTCDLLVCGIIEIPSNPYWAHLSNELQKLRLRMNLELSEVTGIDPRGGWISGIKEIREESPDRPLELTQGFLEERAELQSAEDSLVKALKKLEKSISM